DGMALNITLVSYADQVDFGIIACRRSVPQVQRLIDYMEDALQELEDAAGLKSRPSRKRSPSKASSKAGTKTKAKAKAKTKTKSGAKAKTETSKGTKSRSSTSRGAKSSVRRARPAGKKKSVARKRS
ncbi:MAG: WS/DGAT domain-containing protein, partial [Pseudomonadota bacterium]